MQAWAWALGSGFWDLKPGPSPLQALIWVRPGSDLNGPGPAGSRLRSQPGTSLMARWQGAHPTGQVQVQPGVIRLRTYYQWSYILYDFIQFVSHASWWVSDVLKKCVCHTSRRLPDKRVKNVTKNRQKCQKNPNIKLYDLATELCTSW